MNSVIVGTDNQSASVLELAANGDLDVFKKRVEQDPSRIDGVELWFGRQKSSNKIVQVERNPLMVAATYGSLDIVKYILSLHVVDVNRSCGVDKSTALHCAASGGSGKAIDIVEMLLAAGADPNLTDSYGNCPVDVIFVSPKFQEQKLTLEKLLCYNDSAGQIMPTTTNSNSPPLSPSPGDNSSSSRSDSTSPKMVDLPVSSAVEKREYPVDPSLPDIKNSLYSTDEFRMFSFKVRQCSRAYSHDWTECPFVHPGENARRRDPRKFHYSCVPCPEFRKGPCPRGDSCEYSHGVFECWLHPAQYRTRLCKDGTGCTRRVCFFAHAQEELRPLHVSTGSAVPSPHSGSSNANVMDFAAMNFFPAPPSSMSLMSPTPFTPPLSPANGMSNVAWAQSNVPALHLPGSNPQSSRLRSSLNARNIPTNALNMLPDIDAEMSRISQPTNPGSLNRSAHPKILTPSNLEDLFSVESLSPRNSDQAMPSPVFSPTPRSTVLNQYQQQQQQQQSVISPINTSFSPKSVDRNFFPAYGVGSSGRMSPRNLDSISPSNSRVSMLAQREHQAHRLQQFRSLSSRELGSNSTATVGSPVDIWSNWGSPSPSMPKPDWTTNNVGGRLKRSSSFEVENEEPDLSWVQSLVTESSQEMKNRSAHHASSTSSSVEVTDLNNQLDQVNPSALSARFGKMQL